MHDYVNLLAIAFKLKANVKIATQQKAYMRHQFDFYGLKTPARREIQKPFLIKAYLPEKSALKNLIHKLWLQPQRDFQLFGQELVFKYADQFEKDDIEILEFMIMNKSWWDTVDFIAYKLVGNYFKMYPEQIKPRINTWLQSDNIWFHRTALLFQLKYKTDLDTLLLSHIINSLIGSNEFFINKAIGWILREYSRTNHKWVLHFVENTELHKLSKREALRLQL